MILLYTSLIVISVFNYMEKKYKYSVNSHNFLLR